jgi:hypothetical protein
MNSPADLVQELTRLRKLMAGALLGKLPTASGDFDRTRLDAMIFEEVIQIRRLMLRWLAPGAAKATPRTRTRKKAPPLEEKVLHLLGELQQFVLQHPVAAQKIFAALVAEGRKYAATPAGARRARALAAMPAMARARQFWESSLAGVLEEGEETVLPSSYVEIVMQGALLASPETLLAKIPALASVRPS